MLSRGGGGGHGANRVSTNFYAWPKEEGVVGGGYKKLFKYNIASKNCKLLIPLAGPQLLKLPFLGVAS